MPHLLCTNLNEIGSLGNELPAMNCQLSSPIKCDECLSDFNRGVLQHAFGSGTHKNAASFPHYPAAHTYPMPFMYLILELNQHKRASQNTCQPHNFAKTFSEHALI